MRITFMSELCDVHRDEGHNIVRRCRKTQLKVLSLAGTHSTVPRVVVFKVRQAVNSTLETESQVMASVRIRFHSMSAC